MTSAPEFGDDASGRPVAAEPSIAVPTQGRAVGVADRPTQAGTSAAPGVKDRRGLRNEVYLVAATDALALVGAAALTTSLDLAQAAVVLTALVVFGIAGLYRPRLTLRALDDAPRVLGAVAFSLLALGPAVEQGRRALFLHLAVATVAVLLARTGTYGLLRRLRRSGLYAERTLIIGAGHLGVELAHLLRDQPQHGLRPVGFVDAPLDVRDEGLPLPLLGTIERLDEVLREHEVSRMVVAFGRLREAQWVSIMRSAIGNHVEVHVVPRFFDIGVGPRDIHVDEIAGVPLYRVRRAALRSRGWRVKRAMDVVVSAVALFLLAPLMGALALAVRSTGPQILFRQQRVGQHGQVFDVLKFRSLVQSHDGDTTWSAASGDDRTLIGAILRRTSMDELPQLWNVLRGDMSLVGPRPERPFFAHRFGTDIPGYHDRHRLPVGLTGWAQVNGLRGDTSIPQRARFDNYYVERWSLWFDLVILLRTLPAVLRDVVRKL